MGNLYKNEGVVGAMGDHAVAHDNEFLQDARQALSRATLTTDNAFVLKQLAEVLASRQIEGVELSVRLEGAKQLAALSEAIRGGDVLDAPLAGWRKWLSSLSQGADTVLSVLANVATIAGPVADILGFPITK